MLTLPLCAVVKNTGHPGACWSCAYPPLHTTTGAQCYPISEPKTKYIKLNYNYHKKQLTYKNIT